jgi:hypothetical protein
VTSCKLVPLPCFTPQKGCLLIQESGLGTDTPPTLNFFHFLKLTQPINYLVGVLHFFLN